MKHWPRSSLSTLNIGAWRPILVAGRKSFPEHRARLAEVMDEAKLCTSAISVATFDTLKFDLVVNGQRAICPVGHQGGGDHSVEVQEAIARVHEGGDEAISAPASWGGRPLLVASENPEA